ncbi:MAG: glycosyl hydrolase 115 family protein, partial [Oscillospiraceae bacterium]|nr:glycosyl hydrolase 115 family protein [Oscillospiraceae bacterium]
MELPTTLTTERILYYHMSYLGTPHDYLWVNTTAPALMYSELKK